MALALKKELVAYLEGFVTERRRALFRRVAALRTRYVQAALEDIQDPHDACAVMRSCECFGFQDVHLISRRASFKLSPGVAVGAFKWLTVHRDSARNPESLARRLESWRAEGLLVAAHVDEPDAVPIEELSLERPLALCFGSDGLGLSPELLAAVDVKTRAPARGLGRGFNLSVRAALCLGVLRARLAASDLPWRLDETARLDLELSWLARTPKRVKSLAARFLEVRGLSRDDLARAGVAQETLDLLT